MRRSSQAMRGSPSVVRPALTYQLRASRWLPRRRLSSPTREGVTERRRARGGAGAAFLGAPGVDVPVEGLAVVAEAAVELADEVGSHGELAADEVLVLEGAGEGAGRRSGR